MNATSTEVNAIRKNRWKAVGQLGNTINYFDEKLNEDYKGLMLEAYVCTPDTYPRQDTAWQSIEVAFLEKYGIPLYESRYKKCR